MSEPSNVTPIGPVPPSPHGSGGIVNALRTLREELAREFPDAFAISFEFGTRLLVHIDVRTAEQMTATKARLENLWGGVFTAIQNGATPQHRFFHRITADVER